MIDELDEVLRKLLIRDLPVKNNEVDIAFDSPKREWSARLSRPTINLFLYDVRENQKLRQAQPAWETEHRQDGTVIQRRRAVRVDLHYLITTWTTEAEDQHRLLSRVLLALFRYTSLPEDLLPESLQVQSRQIPYMVAQYNDMVNPAEMWGVLDNEIRPAILLTVTLPVDPFTPITVPLVRERELRMGTSLQPATHALTEPEIADRFWTIGGRLGSQQPLDFSQVRLVVVEQGVEASVQPNGQFAIGRLRAGSYTLEVTVGSAQSRRFPIQIPAADYELEI